MGTFGKMLSRVASVGGMTVASLAAVVVGPTGALPSATAACIGSGNPLDITLEVNGTLRAREANVAGTCNADGTYNGTIGDRREDGKCALVQFHDAGVLSTQGIDCTANNGPVSYVFNDRNGNRQALIRVCLENGPCTLWVEVRGY
jgi:hypothetical protein